jgi:Ca-activated chloride channel family protein
MTFTTPLALLLLIALPIVIYVGFPRIRFRRGRDLVSLLLRALIITLVILALAGMQLVRAADRLAVVYLIDVSDSVGQQAQEAELAYVQQSMAAMRPDDEAAVVVFGGNAYVERPMSSVRELAPLRSTPNTGNSDLQEAIGLGLALFPADAAKRMVILSDGLPTVGDALVVARRAAATGVEISYVQYRRAEAPEVQLSDVEVPGSVGAGQSFDLSLTVTTVDPTPATLRVLASGRIIHSEQVNLNAGANHFVLPLTAGATGFRDFLVQVDPLSSDAFYQNNQLATFSQVVGPPRVLLVSTTDEEAQYLFQALEEQGLTVDLARPDGLPLSVAALAAYNTVILDNVPATALAPARMATLQTYVRDLGGGLVVVGGPDSYAPGGYFKTPLEETLPLDMQIRDQRRLPQLTIAYVIDRSGSMSMIGPSGVENIELAKEAIIRSLDFLQPSDRAGILSFDTQGYWIAEPQPVLDRIGLQNLVGTLRASGGTDILAGMTLAGEAMQNEPSQRKHIILLTDGGANSQGLLELAGSLKQDYDVTTSVIAIGAGAASFLGQMALIGGGNYHPVDTVETIPTIFSQETVLATRSYIIEKQFVPSLTAISPIMDGITSAPPLLGYVATTAKQTAQVILRTGDDFNDPVLASWQYGLGRSVAFTSDATARWAGNWVSWADFARFWSQAVRWTITEGTNNNVEAQVVMEGEQARLVVDVRVPDDDPDTPGAFLNGLNLSTSLVAPDLTATNLRLQQVAPGRYEAVFDPTSEGTYMLALTDDQATIRQTLGWVMSYSPEYRPQGSSILGDIASLTGGKDLSDNLNGAFEHDLVAQASLTPVAPFLLLAGLLLLPFDVAVRRLLVTRSDLARLRNALMRGAEVAREPSERLSSLMGAKARAQQQITSEQGGTIAALNVQRQTQEHPSAAPTMPTAGEQPRYTPGAPTIPASPQKPEGNIAGQLLKRKKERERE